jgi:hypothetical protein
MAKFWELFAESVVIQAAMALILLGVISYLYVVGQEVPDTLVNAFMIILGFYFGGKTQLSAIRRREK